MRSSAALLSGIVCLHLALGAAVPAQAAPRMIFCGTPPPDWPQHRPARQQPMDMPCHMALRSEEETEEGAI